MKPPILITNWFSTSYDRMTVSQIRNFTAAHREADWEQFFVVLEKVQPKLLVDLGQSLRRLLADFHLTMRNVLRDANQLMKVSRTIRTLKPS